jgi:hypothetical protein
MRTRQGAVNTASQCRDFLAMNRRLNRTGVPVDASILFGKQMMNSAKNYVRSRHEKKMGTIHTGRLTSREGAGETSTTVSVEGAPAARPRRRAGVAAPVWNEVFLSAFHVISLLAFFFSHRNLPVSFGPVMFRKERS